MGRRQAQTQGHQGAYDEIESADSQDGVRARPGQADRQDQTSETREVQGGTCGSQGGNIGDL